MVHKEVSANEGTGNVQWTVTLNEDGQDLSGRVFQDEMTYMLGGVTKEYDLKDIQNLRVTAYEINDAGLQVSKGDVTATFEGLIKSEDGAITISFPATGAWPDMYFSSGWAYEIIYKRRLSLGRWRSGSKLRLRTPLDWLRST